MKLDYLKEKKEIVSIGLLGVSAVFGIVILFEVGGYFLAPARAASLVEKFIKNSEPDANDVKEQFDKFRTIANDLKRKNLFVPPVPKRHPVSVVLGIFGSEALINGKWYKTGDKVGDAKVVAVEPTRVRIEWEGNEKIFSPIMGGSSSASEGPRPSRPGIVASRGGDRREGPSVVQAGPGPGGGGMMGGGFGDREAMRARFENMSEAERQAFRDRMRERFGGGRGGPGGGGGFGGGPGGRGGPGGGGGGPGRGGPGGGGSGRGGGGLGRGPGGGPGGRR